MQSIWKLSQCVLRFILLYRLVSYTRLNLNELKIALLRLFDGLRITAIIVLIIQLLVGLIELKIFFLPYTVLPKLFLQIIT